VLWGLVRSRGWYGGLLFCVGDQVLENQNRLSRVWLRGRGGVLWGLVRSRGWYGGLLFCGGDQVLENQNRLSRVWLRGRGGVLWGCFGAVSTLVWWFVVLWWGSGVREPK
jgi:hypothetical protein